MRPYQHSPWTVVGATAVTAALAAYLAWPSSRRSNADTRRRSLIAYLHDHLGGADVAIRVVTHLSSTYAPTDNRALFRQLSQEFDEDRSVVRSLLIQLDASGRSLKRVAGYASGTVLSITAGGKTGDLSLLRTLEALAIGVQGKRCMWRALQDLSDVPPIVDGVTYKDLEARAVRQWDAIEERRRALVARTFSLSVP